MTSVCGGPAHTSNFEARTFLQAPPQAVVEASVLVKLYSIAAVIRRGCGLRGLPYVCRKLVLVSTKVSGSHHQNYQSNFQRLANAFLCVYLPAPRSCVATSDQLRFEAHLRFSVELQSAPPTKNYEASEFSIGAMHTRCGLSGLATCWAKCRGFGEASACHSSSESSAHSFVQSQQSIKSYSML